MSAANQSGPCNPSPRGAHHLSAHVSEESSPVGGLLGAAAPDGSGVVEDVGAGTDVVGGGGLVVDWQHEDVEAAGEAGDPRCDLFGGAGQAVAVDERVGQEFGGRRACGPRASDDAPLRWSRRRVRPRPSPLRERRRPCRRSGAARGAARCRCRRDRPTTRSPLTPMTGPSRPHRAARPAVRPTR